MGHKFSKHKVKRQKAAETGESSNKTDTSVEVQLSRLLEMNLSAAPPISVSGYDVTFDESCGWPRRLLHVASMTSCQWQPGNIYGNIKEPNYNAFSYSWGRWRLQENTQESVGALEIKNINWSVPRLDPKHFTIEQFRTAIFGATTAAYWGNFDQGTEAGKLVDFVWLDVAYIDQRDGQESAAEIGRQFMIFKRAQACAIWLTSMTNMIAR